MLIQRINEQNRIILNLRTENGQLQQQVQEHKETIEKLKQMVLSLENQIKTIKTQIELSDDSNYPPLMKNYMNFLVSVKN